MRFMNSLRADSLMPSKPKPGVQRVVGGDDAALVELVAATRPAVGRVVGALRRRADDPAAVIGLEVVELERGRAVGQSRTSSTQAPRPSVDQSVITEIRRSTFLPA